MFALAAQWLWPISPILIKIEDAGRSLDTQVLTTLTQSDNSYDAALAYYRLAISYNLMEKQEQAKQALDQAMVKLEKLIETETG